VSLAVPVIREDHWRELAPLLFKGPDFQARDQRPLYNKGEVGGSSPPRPTIKNTRRSRQDLHTLQSQDERFGVACCQENFYQSPRSPGHALADVRKSAVLRISSKTILERDENPKNYQRTLRPLYRLNFSSQVITGISSDKAWAMI